MKSESPSDAITDLMREVHRECLKSKPFSGSGWEGVESPRRTMTGNERADASVIFFAVSTPTGESRLAVRAGDREEVWDRATQGIPSGLLHLAAYAVGRHLRDVLNGQVAVHGHSGPLDDGCCGILLDDRGRAKVMTMRVTRVEA